MVGAVSGALSAFGGLVSNVINNNRLQSNFGQQMEFAKYQHEDMKHYNSIQNQVKQMRAAGLNPALMFGKGQQQISAVGQPSAPNTQPLEMNGLASLANTISLNDAQRKNLESDTEKNNQEAITQSIENKFRSDQLIAQINNLKMDYKQKEELIKSYSLNNVFAEKTLEDRIRQQMFSTQLSEASATAQWYTVQYLPQHLQAEIDNMMAQSASAYMNGKASLKQAHAAIMNAVNNKHAFDAQYGGDPKQRSQFFKASLDYLVQQKHTSTSQEFHNINGIPGVMGTGLKFTYGDYYNSWRHNNHR